MTRRGNRTDVRRDRIAEMWAGAWRWVVLAAGAVLAAYFILDRALPNGPVMAAGLALLVIGLAVTGSTPLAVALLVLPALFVVVRIGGGGGLAVSDAALAAGFATAVLLGKRPYSPPLRILLVLNLVYQFATLFTVLVNKYEANTIEWFHAWLLVSGALVMGWALGRAGYAGLALRLLLISALVIAAGTIVAGLVAFARGSFEAVYPSFPFPLQKNAAGTLMAFAALIAWVRPDWAGLSRGWMRAAFWVLLAAIAMTQSRQALIGLLVAIGILSLRGGGARAWWVLLLSIPAAWLIILTVNDQIASQNQFNSFFQRLDWFREVYRIWREEPVFGQGLRFWTLDPAAGFQPPQAELEVLASAGVVGLIGFAVMWLGILIVLWRVDWRFGALAFGAALSRIVQAQFDLFWVAAQVSVPFVIVGVCLGAQALVAEGEDASSPARSRRAVRAPVTAGAQRGAE